MGSMLIPMPQPFSERMYKARIAQWGFRKSAAQFSRLASKRSNASLLSSDSVRSRASTDSGYCSNGSASQGSRFSSRSSSGAFTDGSPDSGYYSVGDWSEVASSAQQAYPDYTFPGMVPTFPSLTTDLQVPPESLFGTQGTPILFGSTCPTTGPMTGPMVSWPSFDDWFLESQGLDPYDQKLQEFVFGGPYVPSYPATHGFGTDCQLNGSTPNLPSTTTVEFGQYSSPFEPCDLGTHDSGYSSAKSSRPSSLLAEMTPPVGNFGPAEYPTHVPLLKLDSPDNFHYDDSSHVLFPSPEFAAEASPGRSKADLVAQSLPCAQNQTANLYYSCPICSRAFSTKDFFQRHMEKTHRKSRLSASNRTSNLQHVTGVSELGPPLQPESELLQVGNSPDKTSAQVLPLVDDPISSRDHESMGQKAETVNQWLEKIRSNGTTTPPPPKSEGEFADFQPSLGGISTPQAAALQRSYSGVSDSPWIESDGEASFVYGDDHLASATPRESANSTTLIDFLAQELVTRFLTRSNELTDTPESSAQESSASSTSGRTTTNSVSITTPASSVPKSSHKRSRVDEDEGEGSRRRKVPRTPDTSQPGSGAKLLACPFTKFDSRRYSERNELEKNYRGCSSCYLRDIARLKQHLYRVHRRPENYCPTCFASFDSGMALASHIVERSCQETPCPFEEKMTSDQLTAVKRRGLGRSERDTWFEIYKLLFPDAPLPLDPYVHSTHADDVQDFIVFFQGDGRQVLSEEINQRMFGTVNASREEQEFVDRVLAESINVLLQRLESRFRQDTSCDS
jgi:hypothetical protein